MIHHAKLRFYAELNDFLTPARRSQELHYPFWVAPSVKDAIEAFGVPHSEVELILVNGESHDFSYRLHDGDRISVYPMFEALDITPLLNVRPRSLRVTRFVVDVNLGRLAAYLRLLGFDVWYRNDADDAELATISQAEQRILLTRDRGLLKRAIISHGYFLRSCQPREQLQEIVQRLDLARGCRPLTRCLRCNGRLLHVAKETVAGELAAGTRAHTQEFLRCAGCGKIYWRGAHWRRMEALLRSAGVSTESR